MGKSINILNAKHSFILRDIILKGNEAKRKFKKLS